MTRIVAEQGELAADLAVPDTIQGVLIARLDRLSGRNTARATLSGEFPTCTLSVCAAGEEHRTILRRMYQWLRARGFLLISIEAGDFDDVMGEWLGVPMFFSCFDPETMKQMINEAGFELLKTAIEI